MSTIGLFISEKRSELIVVFDDFVAVVDVSSKIVFLSLRITAALSFQSIASLLSLPFISLSFTYILFSHLHISFANAYSIETPSLTLPSFSFLKFIVQSFCEDI